MAKFPVIKRLGVTGNEREKEIIFQDPSAQEA
jgi:hypothetical protein